MTGTFILSNIYFQNMNFSDLCYIFSLKKRNFPQLSNTSKTFLNDTFCLQNKIYVTQL